MTGMLSIERGMRVLEPCAGDGVFIDALLHEFPETAIDVYELNPQAVSLLSGKYKFNNNVRITGGDALTSLELTSYGQTGGVYDRIIANPPYGGWQEQEKRARLKKLYTGLYVKETYALFLFRSIRLLRENGRMVFIIPDTYLNLHMHTRLREYLWTHTKIKEIALLPSTFFPGINFKYANLSIITLEKISDPTECLNNEFRVVTGFDRVEELNDPQGIKTFHFKQSNIYQNIDHALFVSDSKEITDLI
ncbi:MAG TPA: N-6 DNA methylase, partial [Pyrinomonadaceae bacterium]